MSNVINFSQKNGGADKVLVTHTDLDGIGGAVIFLKAYPKGVVFFAHNGEVEEVVTQALDSFPACDLLITDLSVNQEMAKALDKRGKVGLLDHHHTARWLAEKYDWAEVSDKDCGTKMIYEMLSPRFHLGDYEFFANLVQDWDVSGWTRPEGHPLMAALEYQFMFHFMGRERFLSEMLFDPHFINDDKYAWIKDRLIEQYEAYYARTSDILQVNNHGPYLTGIVVADEHQSLMGSRMVLEYNLEYVMMIDIRNSRVSLRGRGNVHLGEMAKDAGGGGHARAAGFPLSQDALASFLAQ